MPIVYISRFPNERSVRSIQTKRHSPLPLQLILKMTVFIPLKQRKCKFRKVDLYENVTISAAVSVGVSRMGKTGIVFVEPGAKVNSEYYCEHVLRQGLLPVIQATCGHHNWTLQQDGAPSHTARNMTNFLRQENVNFIEPDMWPLNSPDLNPVDYAVWGTLQENVYLWGKFTAVEQLKLAIIEEWRTLGQHFIDSNINEWRRRLEKLVQKQGGHMEHDF